MPSALAALWRTGPLRELLVVLAFCLFTALLTWPYVTRMRDAVVDPGDPYLVTWIMWWDYHQTFRDPLHLFHSNTFYPLKYTLAFSEHFEGDGPAFFQAAVKHGLEGIVSKRANNTYRSGPSRHWVKVKNMTESEFILLGLERDTEGRAFAHVGQETGKGLTYAGTAFMTFGEKLYSELARKADGLATVTCAVKGVRRPRAT